jgi:hypothetical protein
MGRNESKIGCGKSDRMALRHNAVDLYLRCFIQLSAGSLGILTGFSGFPRSTQANVIIVTQLGHKHFLPNPFQFIIYQSLYHSMLYTVQY